MSSHVAETRHVTFRPAMLPFFGVGRIDRRGIGGLGLHILLFGQLGARTGVGLAFLKAGGVTIFKGAGEYGGDVHDGRRVAGVFCRRGT